MLPLNLFVVRHGESIGNLAKRMIEKGDPRLFSQLHGTHTAQWPLTKKGIAQAESSGLFLKNLNISFERMYVSSYARAMQTAARLDLPNASWIADPRITERDWGDFDHMTEEERMQKFKHSLEMQKIEPFFWRPPGGESFNDLVLRLRDAVESLARADVRNAIVVCHGEVMKGLRIIFEGLIPTEYAEMEFSEDPLRRIHNAQIDHYSRENPNTKEESKRVEWLQVYRPYMSENSNAIAVPWRNLPRRRFENDDLLRMATQLSRAFSDLDL